MKNVKRFTTYTDESGTASKVNFIVVTAIVQNTESEIFQQKLTAIEEKSGKKKKYFLWPQFTFPYLIIKKIIYHLFPLK